MVRIAVLIKEVPDTNLDRHLDLETGLTIRDRGAQVLDEASERALEWALTYADTAQDTEVVVVMVGPESAEGSVRNALAIGAHRAVHVVDPRLRGADIVLTGQVLAAALRLVDAQLVVAGNVSTDGGGGVLPAVIAELLEIPHLTALSSVELGDSTVRGVRIADDGTLTAAASLPAVISVTEAFPAARLPTFKGVLAAKKKTVERPSLGDLGIDPDDPHSPRSILISVAPRAARKAGVTVHDDGTAAEQLAAFLIENRVVRA